MGDIKAFSADLDKFASLTKVNVGTVRKRVAMELYGKIIKKTPRKTGRAKVSWNLALGSADESTMPEGEYSEQVVSQKLTQAALKLTPKELPYVAVHISNNLDYIQGLEDGRSEQAPPGTMVALSIAEVEASVNLITDGLAR